MAGQLVLVTGGSGHLGFKVLATALESGYSVRAAVRSNSKAEDIKAAPSVQPYLEKLEFILVPDILADGAYDEAVKGVDFVIHVASPLVISEGDYQKVMIDPAVKGTTGILRSALRAKSLKRIVITSSEAAIVTWKDLMLTESPEIFNSKSMVPPPPGPYGHPFEAYGASKALALHASLAFMEKEKPAFDLINIMPSFIIGKNELVTSLADITNGTNGFALRVVSGVKATAGTPGNTVLLADVAKVHVLALEPKITGNQNFLVSSSGPEGTVWNDALEITKRLYPDEVKKGLWPVDGDLPSKKCLLDSSYTEEVFGFKLAGYEAQVKSVLDHYVELAKKEKKL